MGFRKTLWFFTIMGTVAALWCGVLAWLFIKGGAGWPSIGAMVAYGGLSLMLAVWSATELVKGRRRVSQ